MTNASFESNTSPKRIRFRVIGALFAAGSALLLLVLLLQRGGSPDPASPPPATEEQAEAPEAAAGEQAVTVPLRDVHDFSQPTILTKWGLSISSVRLSVGGNALDVRYVVMDPGKASLLATNTGKTYLINNSSGTNLINQIPFQPLVAQEMSAGKTYFTFLPNRGKLVKPGNTVTLVVGGIRSDGFVVQ